MFRTTLILATCVLSASARGQNCLPDSNGDGHPLFGHTSVRTSPWHTYPNVLDTATSMATGDLDGDGDLDIAVTCFHPQIVDSSTARITILRNLGDGVFEDTVQYDGGKDVRSVTIGDVDGDGDLDLAVCNEDDNAVSVLFNNGNATFTAPQRYSVGLQPRSLVMTDLDGDGDLDLAALNLGNQTVSTLLNSGNGTFARHQTYSATNGTAITSESQLAGDARHFGPSMTCADIDNDGDQDLIIPARNTVSVLRNSGTGSFTTAVHYGAVGSSGTDSRVVCSVTAGDMNGDGWVDVVTANFEDATVSVLLNNGAGSLAYTPYSVKYQYNNPGHIYRATNVALGDFDSDGDLDVAVGMGGPDMEVVLLRNNGSGVLGPLPPSLMKWITIAPGPCLVLARDLNGDRATDLAALARQTGVNELVVVFNDGEGSFVGNDPLYQGEWGGAAPPMYPWINKGGVVLADLNEDGSEDFVVANAGSSYVGANANVAVLLNSGDGQFDPQSVNVTVLPHVAVGSGIAEFALADDLNGDGHVDIVVADQGRPVPPSGQITVESAFWLLFGNGDGTLSAPVSYSTDYGGWGPSEAALSDMDGDGDRDVVLVSPRTNSPQTRGRLRVWLNNGGGQFAESYSTELGEVGMIGNSRARLAVMDIDDDGDADVVCHDQQTAGGYLFVFENVGDGTLALADTIMASPAKLEGLELADLDDDGDADLVVGHHNNSTPFLLLPHVTVYFNDGQGHFGAPAAYWIPNMQSQTRAIEAQDMDGDGDLDLILGHYAVSVMFNNGDGTFAPARSYGTGIDPQIAVGDIDHDGDKDVIVSDRTISILRNHSCNAPAPCPADTNNSGAVDVDDLIAVILGWGPCGKPPACPADTNHSGTVDVDDLIAVILNWGPCE